MKVIITGGSGFVGVNLQDYLKTSYVLQSISVRYLPNQQFDLNSGAIIHLAGKAHDLKKVSNPQDYYEANFKLTKQLFDAFLISEALVFIFMSTVKAVADEVKDILDEDGIPNPKTHYGIAKHQAEEYMLSKEIPKSKRVYILRPCMIHGPNNKGNLNLLYSFVSKGIPYPFGKYVNRRSFVSIDNLCFIINELIDNAKIESGVYNIADDTSLSTIDLVELMSEILNKQVKILNIPKLFVQLLAKVGDVIPIPINSERLQKLTENYEVSNLKIKKAIQKELPLSAKEGIRKTIASF